MTLLYNDVQTTTQIRSFVSSANINVFFTVEIFCIIFIGSSVNSINQRLRRTLIAGFFERCVM